MTLGFTDINVSRSNSGGRTRIRTRVSGLEGRSDIQTTPCVQPNGRRHPSSTSPAASQRPGALDAACRGAHGRALPRVTAMLAGPRLDGLVGQHLGTQALEER